jgi:hypothetical protein
MSIPQWLQGAPRAIATVPTDGRSAVQARNTRLNTYPFTNMLCASCVPDIEIGAQSLTGPF